MRTLNGNSRVVALQSVNLALWVVSSPNVQPGCKQAAGAETNTEIMKQQWFYDSVLLLALGTHCSGRKY